MRTIRYQQHYINHANFYSVGIDELTGDAIIEVVITGMGWYSRYFTLTEEEMAQFRENQTALTRLAKELTADKGERFFTDRLVRLQ